VSIDDPNANGESSFTESEHNARVPDPFDIIELRLLNLTGAVERADRLVWYVESRLHKAGIDIQGHASIDRAASASWECDRHWTDSWSVEKQKQNGVRRDTSLDYFPRRGGVGRRIYLAHSVFYHGVDPDADPYLNFVEECLFSRPLLECPTRQKLCGIRFLPALLSSIAQRVKEEAEYAHRTLDEIGKMLGTTAS
jgi:hypothetical protein